MNEQCYKCKSGNPVVGRCSECIYVRLAADREKDRLAKLAAADKELGINQMTKETKQEIFKKYDAGKPQLSLISAEMFRLMLKQAWPDGNVSQLVVEVPDIAWIRRCLSDKCLAGSQAEMLAEVLQHGADKYGNDNWRLNTDISRAHDAYRRHLLAAVELIAAGRDPIDSDSGLRHEAHMLANLMFMLELVKE